MKNFWFGAIQPNNFFNKSRISNNEKIIVLNKEIGIKYVYFDIQKRWFKLDALIMIYRTFERKNE